MKQFSENDLKIIASAIDKMLWISLYKPKTTIFLCGASKNQENSGRYHMTNLLKEHTSKFELLFPEDLFEDLMAGSGGVDLLTAENLLASSVDAIILFPESAGSLAELGAFSYNPEVATKTICFIEYRRRKKKSFINYGPVRLIKASKTGKVYSYKKDEFIEEDKKQNLLRKVTKSISIIKEQSPSKEGFGNILITDQFVLPCVYLFDSINIKDLIKLVMHVSAEKKALSDLAVRSALLKLVSEKLIYRTSGERGSYSITQKGEKYVTNRYYMKSLRDSLRMEIMNSQYRKKTSIQRKQLFLV